MTEGNGSDALKAVEAAVSTAVSEYAPKPKDDLSGAQSIIDNYIKNTGLLEALLIQRVDAAIDRLQNLKALVQGKTRKSLDEVTELVRLVDDGLRDVDLIEQKVTKIEDAVIQS